MKKINLVFSFFLLSILAIFFLLFLSPASQQPLLITIKRQKNNIRIFLVGDIMLSRGVGKQAEKNQDWAFPFNNVSDFLAQADLTVGNLESPLSNLGEDRGHLYSFRARPEMVEGLKQAGFDVLWLANNHMMDWGQVALDQTVKILNQNNIQTVGAGQNKKAAERPVLIEVSGTQIGFLAFTDIEPRGAQAKEDSGGVAWIETSTTKKAVEELRKKVDLLIVSYHTGTEYQTKANSRQVRLFRQTALWGADLVVGHHPHVLQNVEQYRGKYLIYSLGNFVFDQSFSSETQKSLILELGIKEGKIKEINYYPIKISPETFQPILIDHRPHSLFK